MLGGMVTAPLLSLFIVPAVYALLRRPRRARRQADAMPVGRLSAS
jgi:Cu(I)/Ag(I) efflux system membrane protein CusA/SilA